MTSFEELSISEMVKFNLPGDLGAIDIRTFESDEPLEMIANDFESAGERTPGDEAVDNTVNDAIVSRTNRGLAFLNDHAATWEREPPDTLGNVMIRKPTASTVPHFAVHGRLIEELRPTADLGGEMTDIARILGAPDDFDEKLAEMTALPTSRVLSFFVDYSVYQMVVESRSFRTLS